MSPAPQLVSTGYGSSIDTPSTATSRAGGEVEKALRPACPGDLATRISIWQLADEYRSAAHTLLEKYDKEKRGKRQPLSLAPCRLSALHAIELYLNAFLLHRGHEASGLRSLQHDFGKRTDMAIKAGLVLRELTKKHLHEITGKREYVVSRYGPEEMTATTSQINRLMSTLDKVAKKVSRFIYTENLLPEAPSTGPDAPAKPAPLKPPSAAIPVLNKALAQIETEDGWASLGGVGTQVANLVSDFDARTYGCSKLSDLVRKTGAFDVEKAEGGHMRIRKKKK